MILWILLFLLLMAVLTLPSIWVNQVLQRHSASRDDFPGTGGDMARHLLRRNGLDDVTVEETGSGDHYDPSSRTVRLTADKLNGKSLTAVVVAAHEVGHAIQHARREPMFRSRTGMAHITLWLQRLAPVALLLAPLLAPVLPVASRLSLLVAIVAMLAGTLMHLLTLPVELDASFNKALPLLQEGEYLDDEDMQHARKILKAAALTYVSASLASLLNVWQWLRFLRR
jgi:uncharacterized protein